MNRAKKITEEELLHGDLRKVFLHYLFPAVSATFLIAANYLIDTICVGQKVGETGIAALNVSVPVTGLFYALGYLFAYGSSNLFSNHIGAGEKEKARVYYGTSVKSLFLIALILMGLGIGFNDQITWLLCNGASFYKEASEYLYYVFVFTPFYCLETFYVVYVRNDGSPIMSAVGTFTTSVTNILLDFLFVWVLDLGLAGASAATGLGLVFGFGIDFSQTFRKNSLLKIRGSGYSLKSLRKIVITGFSNFIREFSGSFLVLIVNIILLDLSGETAVAVYGVIANLGNVVMCALTGASNAIQPIIAVNLGGKQYDRVRRLLKMGIIASTVMALAYTAFAEIAPQLLIAIFLDHPTEQLQAMCIPGIRIISPGYIAAGITTVYNVYFESTLRSKNAFWIALIRGLIAPVTAIAVFVRFFGVEGVWLSFLVAELFSLWCAIRIERNFDLNGSQI